MTPGTNPDCVTLEQDTSTISASVPGSSIFTSGKSQSPVKKKAIPAEDNNRLPKKVHRGKDHLSAIKSPEYSSVRSSPCHTVWIYLFTIIIFLLHLP